MNNPILKHQINALKNGTAKHINGNLSIDLTGCIYHVGRTGVVFNTFCNNSVCTTGFVGFVQSANHGSVATSPDSFSDPLDIGIEIPPGVPFYYIPYSWSITYKNNFYKRK